MSTFQNVASALPVLEASERPTADEVYAVHAYDPLLIRPYQFADQVSDVVTYGDYLIVAVGARVEIVHIEQPELRASVAIDSGRLKTHADW